MKKLKNFIMNIHSMIHPTKKVDLEREEKINYYRDLFWLTFRIYDEDEDCDVYDNYNTPLSLSSVEEEEIKFFEERFTALNAKDVFNQLCYEYYEARLVHLKKSVSQQTLMNLLTLDANTIKTKDNVTKKRRSVSRLVEAQKENIRLNFKAQKDCETEMLHYKKEL